MKWYKTQKYRFFKVKVSLSVSKTSRTEISVRGKNYVSVWKSVQKKNICMYDNRHKVYLKIIIQETDMQEQMCLGGEKGAKKWIFKVFRFMCSVILYVKDISKQSCCSAPTYFLSWSDDKNHVMCSRLFLKLKACSYEALKPETPSVNLAYLLFVVVVFFLYPCISLKIYDVPVYVVAVFVLEI